MSRYGKQIVQLVEDLITFSSINSIEHISLALESKLQEEYGDDWESYLNKQGIHTIKDLKALVNSIMISRGIK